MTNATRRGWGRVVAGLVWAAAAAARLLPKLLRLAVVGGCLLGLWAGAGEVWHRLTGGDGGRFGYLVVCGLVWLELSRFGRDAPARRPADQEGDE